MNVPVVYLFSILAAPALLPMDDIWFSRCAPCHGEHADGNGPAAQFFNSDALRFRGNRRWADPPLAEIADRIARGRPSAGMPAFAGHLTAEQLKRLAGRIRAWASRSNKDRPSADDEWWLRPLQDGGGLALSMIGSRVIPQTMEGLSAQVCGRCHLDKLSHWSESRHAAAVGPGLLGQYHGFSKESRTRCDGCHAPLASQANDGALHSEGVTCAVCHVRHGRKHGPPRLDFKETESWVRGKSSFLRSDFCLSCHNLPLSEAVNGRPLLDTWREWASSQYLPQGVQCQSCHIKNGEHRFAGAHHLEMVQEAIRVELSPLLEAGGVLTWRIAISNIGAGHHFPTTATPRALVRIRQLEGEKPVNLGQQDWFIGRLVHRKDGQWFEEADTRIPAGATWTRTYQKPLSARADGIDVTVYFYPDWLYVGVYESLLKTPGTEIGRDAIRRALKDAGESAMTLFYQRVEL